MAEQGEDIESLGLKVPDEAESVSAPIAMPAWERVAETAADSREGEAAEAQLSDEEVERLFLTAVFDDVRAQSADAKLVQPAQWLKAGLVPAHFSAEDWEMFVYEYLEDRRAERDARVVAASATPVRTATRAVGVPRILRTEEEPESEGAATAKGAEEPRQPERSSEASEEPRHPERSAEGAESKDLVRRDGACAPGDGLSDRLAALSRLAKQRFASRERAGGLDFDSVEARVVLDEEGSPTGIDLRVKTDATSLIEEAMILANETVAKHLRDAKFPSLYRVHEQPSADSLAALVPVFQDFAWFRDIDQADFIAGDAHVVQRVLEASAERPEGELVSTLLLRSMKRAVYRPDCAAHYGLASGAYTHFTSPIRRYPDLVVHRMLKALIGGRPEKFDQEKSALPWIAEHSSDMERIAEKAARESQEVKLIEYLERFVGQTFSATVSGVATYGAYVRLDNTAEGLIPCKNLGSEYFALDPVQHRLTGQDTGASYRLAQRLAVVLVSADPRARRLDFRPARDER